MEKDNRNAYSEVIEILKFLDDEKKLEALPIEMLEVLKSKANPEHKPQISKDIPLEEQNLQPETMQILAWIATKYWAEDLENVEEKQDAEVAKNSQENIVENNSEVSEKTSINEELEKDIEEQNKLPILHNGLKWYEKIKEKIIEFFEKIFRRKKKKGNTL
mgnify:FL=1